MNFWAETKWKYKQKTTTKQKSQNQTKKPNTPNHLIYPKMEIN